MAAMPKQRSVIIGGKQQHGLGGQCKTEMKIGEGTLHLARVPDVVIIVFVFT